MDFNLFKSEKLVNIELGSKRWEVFQAISNWLYLKFGAELELKRQQQECKNEHELKNYRNNLQKIEPNNCEEFTLKQQNLIGEFKREIIDYILTIKEENIKVPDQQIIAAIMENINIYLSVDDVRNKFAKLIARASDSSYSDDLHPLFVETIKNLTVEDAVFLQSFGDIGAMLKDSVRIKRTSPSKTIAYPLLPPDQEDNICLEFISRIDINGELDIKNKYFDSQDFLDKQNIVTIKSTEKVSGVTTLFLANNIQLMKNFIEENEDVLKYKHKFEKYYNTAPQLKYEIDHDFSVIELTNFGRKFKKVIIDD